MRRIYEKEESSHLLRIYLFFNELTSLSYTNIKLEKLEELHMKNILLLFTNGNYDGKFLLVIFNENSNGKFIYIVTSFNDG